MIPVPIPLPAVDPNKEPDHVAEGFLQGMSRWGSANMQGILFLLVIE